MNTTQIEIGSRWERLASGNVWTVKDLNPNGTVTLALRRHDDGEETEVHDPEFFLGAFRKVPSENPLARVHYGQ